ncbi:hypothetical protein [Bacteroides sp.]|uniref:hypothetical protein n=1 Tax=Bacteroides sp. TaxID=29523 RepID=UPI002FC738DE
MKNNFKLKEALSLFQGANGNESNLPEQFNHLAKYFLYSGYLLINSRTKIYLRDIEFYYHEEAGNIKDPIMYHRNTKKNKDVSYFPLGLLHTHQSGIDITFENKQKQYRASILIRGFNIIEGESTLSYNYDKFSTHIYEALFMQASLLEGIHIEWIHEPAIPYQNDRIETAVRVNVCKFDENGNKEAYKGSGLCTINKKYVQDERQWRFIRKIE